MSTADLVLIQHDGHVTTLTLNRADKMNALSPELLSALDAALGVTAAREETRCVIITGAGKAFVAGADIAAMTAMGEADSRAFGAQGHRVFRAIEELRCPVIAAVNGFALGGGLELALACDFVHASEKAKVGLPEVGLGIIPGFGGTQRLARRVGVGLARELVYTGGMIDAAEAHRIGIVNGVHAPDALLPAVAAIANSIATKGPLAIAAAKRVIRDGLDRTLPDGNALEIAAFGGLFGTDDQREGMGAFLEKRPAKFTGR
ncbi:MAG: enoyl-CoA hydratase/isomerase family protein [Polyangiaceae bacterium]|nr:enoyl-CoA hydratase/isomerase family protein [Polyangiaceae bacterium]